MRIIKLVMHKSNRLALGNIETFSFTPEAPTQFIIGTNGAGKTTIVKACSPLPADKDDYDDGGYERKTIDHNGSIFEVTSKFEDGGQEHSFVKDGVELNKGGGVKFQCELVKQYFNYTHEIHDIITTVTGDVGLTNMSLGARKQVFTMAADANYDFAISVYKRLTDKYNESRHTLRRMKERLVMESAKVVPPEELEKLKNETTEIYHKVQKLIEDRQPLLPPAQELLGGVPDVQIELANLSKETRQLIRGLKGQTIPDKASLRESIASKRHSLESLQVRANELFEEHQKINKVITTLRTSNIESAADIQTKIDKAQEEIRILRSKMGLDIEINGSPQTVIDSCGSILNVWGSYAGLLGENRNKEWNRANRIALCQAIEAADEMINKGRASAAKLEQTIEHQNHHKHENNVNCPSCGSEFKPNFSALVLVDATNRLNNVKTSLVTLEEAQAERRKSLAAMDEYFVNFQAAVRLFQAPGMDDFLSYITKDNLLLNKPSDIPALLLKYKETADYALAISKLEESIASSRKFYLWVLQMEEAGQISNTDAQLEVVLKKIGDVEFSKNTLQREINSLNNLMGTIDRFQFIEDRLKAGTEYIDNAFYMAADSVRREVYAEYLRHFQSTLATKEQALQLASNQESVVNHIKTEIAELELDVHDYKILMKEMSPTEGLIARGILGFVKMMTEEMNKTLEQLFEYPLSVLPCSLDESESLNLNYKFPLKVDNRVRADISKGSSGMREAINLAFVVALMKSLGLQNYILFLDEFGSKLDPVHKQNAIMMLANVVELERFEQVFFISHDITQYNSFGKSEICVLHAANAQLPENCTYNKHVTMT